jgi:hypothetical protein
MSSSTKLTELVDIIISEGRYDSLVTFFSREIVDQIKKKKNITLEKGMYWSTLKLEGHRSKIKEIGKMVQDRVPTCKK